MSKYIDAEKLIAEIEKIAKKYIDPEWQTVAGNTAKSIRGELRAIITSLQQEQEQYVIGGQVFGATDIEQYCKGKVYIVSKLVQDKEFGIQPREQVKMLLIKD